MNRIFFLIILSATLSSCGYFNSGIWEDDPETWNKVFGEDVPNEVEIIHSQFWKSAHWSYEFEVFFELKTSHSFFKSYFINNQHFEVKKVNYLEMGEHYFQEKPNWFLPKTIENYIIWTNEQENLKIFVDKKTYHIFYTYFQV